jgi:hypothetical protein
VKSLIRYPSAPRIEGFLFFFLIGLSGDHESGNLTVRHLPLHMPDELQSVHVGHVEVSEYHIDISTGELCEVSRPFSAKVNS